MVAAESFYHQVFNGNNLDSSIIVVFGMEVNDESARRGRPNSV